MPTIVREDHDDLNLSITINIAKEDYEKEFNQKLKEYSKQANLKGFRKGQVPISMIRKMYGKETLSGILDEILNKELDNFLRESDDGFLGQPLSADQEAIQLATKELKDYSFKFDLGLTPEFELKGLEDAFDKYQVNVPEETIEKTLTEALTRMGKREKVEDELREGDVFKVEAKELEEDGETIKENGLAPTFSLSFDELTADVVEKVFTKKVGSSFIFDIFNLSKDKDEAFVKKHFLQLDEDLDTDVEYGHQFEAIIVEVNRIIPAELNQEFYDNYFGAGIVSTEEGAKAKIKEQFDRFFDNQADILLFEEIVKRLKAKNPLSFPKDFLVRWIEQAKQNEDGKTAEETFDNMEEGLQWEAIQGKLAKEHAIGVSPDEVRQQIRAQVMNIYGGYGGYGLDDIVDNLVESLSKNTEYVNNAYNQVLTQKIFYKLKEVITINPVPIEEAAFKDLLEAKRAENAPKENIEEEEATETPEEEATEMLETDS